MSFKEFAATEKAAKRDKPTEASTAASFIGPPNKAIDPEVKTPITETVTIKA
jgi:hypothetical protein